MVITFRASDEVMACCEQGIFREAWEHDIHCRRMGVIYL